LLNHILIKNSVTGRWRYQIPRDLYDSFAVENYVGVANGKGWACFEKADGKVESFGWLFLRSKATGEGLSKALWARWRL
jgi:hypothetical protein